METDKQISRHTVDTFAKNIKKAMEEMGIYKPAFDMTIHLLASTFKRYEQARKMADKELIITEKSREGNSRKSVSPAFVVEVKCLELIRKYAKELGLFLNDKSTDDDDADTKGEKENDQISELTNIMNGIERKTYRYRS